MRDIIRLEGLRVHCIVGVYRPERTTPQPLDVSVALYLDTRRAAEGAGLAGTVDYARLAGELRFILERCRFKLLEDAAEVICRYVLISPSADAPHAQVVEVAVRLTKPNAMAGAAVPSLELQRTRGDFNYAVEDKPFGQVDVVYERPELGLYRLRVKPGGAIPSHLHRVMDENELVLGRGLLLQGRPVERGTAFHWPKGFVHRYDNPSDTEQSILCIDSPCFRAEDEVEVEINRAALQPLDGSRYYPAGDLQGAE